MADESIGSPIKLLVVDDEPDTQVLFESRFRRDIKDGRLEIDFASGAIEALELIESSNDIEVIVTDLNMPGMDGLELLSRVEAMCLPLKTIVLTAYGDMDNIRTAMMRGAFDFQMKPLDINDLRATIDKASSIVRELRSGEEARRQVGTLEARNRHLQEVFGKYVSEEVVTELLKHPSRTTLAGERRVLTFLMADIRGFTRIAEEFPPEQVVATLNGYLEVAIHCILSYGGTINEILGDGLLVFFGAPIDDPESTEHAVAAAIEMQLGIAELNDKNRAIRLPEVAVGIGVHTGEAVVGTIGSDQRMKYAAVGHHVNLVARIETQTVGGQILLSQASYELVQDLVTVTGQFSIQTKGLSAPLTLYTVRGIGGAYDLVLPQRTRELDDAARHPIEIARVVEKRVTDVRCGFLLAASRDAARIETALVLAPLDDAVIYLQNATLYGKVTECTLIDEVCHMTVVYTAASERALDTIERMTES